LNLATLSVIALLVAILVSCITSINVGLLAIVFAWLIGVLAAGMRLDEVLAGFPSQLFITLLAVTLLFGQDQANGTLQRLTARAVRLCRGSRGSIAIMFFAVTLALSSAGPGNIGSAALVAPLAMDGPSQLSAGRRPGVQSDPGLHGL
jgi:di/tricarboxylate transporter